MTAPTDALTDSLTDSLAEIVREIVRDELEQAKEEIAPAARPEAADPDDMLTTEEAAERIGMAPYTLRRWRSDENPDGPPFSRYGRAIRYRRGDLDAWTQTRKDRK